jgi:hypothetical protein
VYAGGGEAWHRRGMQLGYVIHYVPDVAQARERPLSITGAA